MKLFQIIILVGVSVMGVTRALPLFESSRLNRILSHKNRIKIDPLLLNKDDREDAHDAFKVISNSGRFYPNDVIVDSDEEVEYVDRDSDEEIEYFDVNEGSVEEVQD